MCCRVAGCTGHGVYTSMIYVHTIMCTEQEKHTLWAWMFYSPPSKYVCVPFFVEPTDDISDFSTTAYIESFLSTTMPILPILIYIPARQPTIQTL